MPRIAFPRPRAHDGKTGVPEEVNHIIFLHPGYESGAQSLLLLPACDDDDTIDYEVARIACAIVACNRYDGYFTTDQAGLQRVPEPRLDCTNEGYFFQVPNRSKSSYLVRGLS